VHRDNKGNPLAMPESWRRRIERMGDSAGCLRSMTPADIKTAQARAKGQKRQFGFGWVEAVMRDKAAVRPASAVTAAGTPETKAAQERQAMDKQKEDEIKNARNAYFDGLPAPTRKHYLTQARLRAHKDRPDLVEPIARAMAWQEKQGKVNHG
jgi:hypothetical protein